MRLRGPNEGVGLLDEHLADSDCGRRLRRAGRRPPWPSAPRRRSSGRGSAGDDDAPRQDVARNESVEKGVTENPAPSPSAKAACLLCGSTQDPTDEHIIPQTLWNRFGIDPDLPHLAQYRTTLCFRHNQATSALHQRTAVMDLIEHGGDFSAKTLLHLADWAIWVTLLLSLARGSGILGEDASRAILRERFDSKQGGTPAGVRVYAARVAEHVAASDPPSPRYTLALVGDPRVALDDSGRAVGMSARTGPINASESIGLGKVALLVVGKTYSSGPQHEQRLDAAATEVGLERIWPPAKPLPALAPVPVSIADVSRLFTVMPLGPDMSLTPPAIQNLLDSLDANQ